ncbi:hypothetical protein FQZ97_1064580 [compost metagenome]
MRRMVEKSSTIRNFIGVDMHASEGGWVDGVETEAVQPPLPEVDFVTSPGI